MNVMCDTVQVNQGSSLPLEVYAMSDTVPTSRAEVDLTFEIDAISDMVPTSKTEIDQWWNLDL